MINLTCSAARVLWRLPLEQNKCADTYDMCAASDLVSRQWHSERHSLTTFRTWQVMLASYPKPSVFPTYRHDYNSVLSYEFNWAVLQAGVYLAYYLLLLPSAAVSDPSLRIHAMLTQKPDYLHPPNAHLRSLRYCVFARPKKREDCYCTTCCMLDCSVLRTWGT